MTVYPFYSGSGSAAGLDRPGEGYGTPGAGNADLVPEAGLEPARYR